MKLIICILVVISLVGCSEIQLGKYETASSTTASVLNKVEQVAAYTAPYTGGNGALVAAVASGLGNIALAFSVFFKNRKIQNVAKAASMAADQTTGGGLALVSAAKAMEVLGDIKSAYIKRG